MSIGFRGAGAQVATVTSGGSLSPALPTEWARDVAREIAAEWRKMRTEGESA